MCTPCSNAPRRRLKVRMPLLAAAAATALLAAPGTARAASGTTWRAVYWNNTSMSGTPALRQTQSAIGFNSTAATSVYPSLATTHWSAEYTAAPQFAAGTYVFTVTVDDGARLWVDGNLLINRWVPEPAVTLTSAPVSLAGGVHQVKLDYFQDTYAEVLSLTWAPAATGKPANVSPPIVTGTAQVGSVLTASTGAWSNRPTAYTYQWQRDQANIAGATGASYTCASADVSHRLDVVVTASNGAGSSSATSPATTVVVVPTPTSSALDTLIGDVTLPNQGYPHGIPSSYSFYAGPELDNPLPPGGMSAATSWGVVWEAAEGSSSVNTRVEVRGEELWLWSNSRHQWVEYQASMAPDGQDFYEPSGQFANQSYPAALRSEPDGGISVKMDHGAWFHFWPAQGRVSISPWDVGGVFTTFQARLVMDDPSGPNDMASARYVAAAGSDWWADLSAPWPNNAQVFYDRFVYVTPSWQSFYGASWSPDQLRQNPPPFDAGT